MTWAPPVNLATDMEHATTAHANRWPHAQATDSSALTTSNTREISRTCADHAHQPPNVCHRHHWTRSNAAPTSKQPSNHGRAPRTRREEPTTEDHAVTQAPLNANIVAKQKPVPRLSLSKPSDEDAAIDGEDAIILQTLSRSWLRDDAPKEEKDAKTPPSPDPTDLRFPSGAQALGRRWSTSTTTLPRKTAATAGAAVAGSGEDRSKDFSRRCADPPPPTAAHEPPPLPRPTPI
ncbi:hypothetical protein VPH35_076988 [Triticum aestivum]